MPIIDQVLDTKLYLKRAILNRICLKGIAKLVLAMIELVPPPLHLLEVRISFDNLVNKYGADDNPRGKTVNRKYFTTPSPKSQEKAKYHSS